MTRSEIVYGWLLQYLDHVANSEAGEQYVSSLDAAKGDSFARLADDLREHRNRLVEAQVQRSHYSDWPSLELACRTLHEQYSDFPDARPVKTAVAICLATRIAELDLPLDVEPDDANPDTFELRKLANSIPIAWFSYTNTQSFENSVAVLTCSDLAKFKVQLFNDDTAADLLFYSLAAMRDLNELPSTTFAFVKKMAGLSDVEAEAFVNLVMLANGECVHAPRHYTVKPRAGDISQIAVGIPYQQMNEVMYVLSEYNSRSDLLAKLLTLYHVVENFMYRLPIVELERKKGGKLFSIRDFRTLYKSVEERELQALRAFFKKVFAVVASPNITFQDQISAEWTAYASSMEVDDLEAVLARFDLRKQGDINLLLSGGDAAHNFANMVYAIRNAIVHNKETEFHLTYAELDAHMCSVIERFLMPVLEEICFALIAKQNSLVWYKNQNLRLHQ